MKKDHYNHLVAQLLRHLRCFTDFPFSAFRVLGLGVIFFHSVVSPFRCPRFRVAPISLIKNQFFLEHTMDIITDSQVAAILVEMTDSHKLPFRVLGLGVIFRRSCSL
jgi:hypothetical protein